MTNHPTTLVLSHFEFEGFRTVMPAQAGIQGEQAAASGYSAWIPAFAGMTQHSSTPQHHRDSLLDSYRFSHAICCSNACPARRSVASSKCRPVSMSPTGRPFDLPHGTLSEG